MIDIVNANVRGKCRKSSVRVIWNEGKLYISSSFKTDVYDVPTYSQVGENYVFGEFNVFPRKLGCGSCAKSRKTVSAEEIMGRVKS